MAVDQTRYRVVDFVGGRILEAREMNILQDISQGVSTTGATTSYEQTAIYRQGALLNATIAISGSVVTISPTDNTQPVLVFVRDRWEAFTTSELTSTTITGSVGFVYLNWQLVLVTSIDDPTLIDGDTGQPTANMGQLVLEISATDDSARAVAATELAKNTITIQLARFALLGGTYLQTNLDNLNARSYANAKTGGMTKLTTNTSAGIAVADDDPRMSDARAPIAQSVVDASVRTPTVQSGTNADGTPVYDLTVDAGGINATKIVLQAGKQVLSDAYAWLKNSFTSLLGRYNNHEGVILGLSNTHPFPTPAQVGAAPKSHIGLPLNLSTSHPATVNQSSGGFVVNRISNPDGSFSSIGGDPAYGVYQGANNIASLNHNGDIFSALANTVVASPGGGPINYSGSLGYLSWIATVLADHVNQNSHANPHGITLADLGGAGVSQSYVDGQDAAVLAAAKSYANSIASTLTLYGVNGYMVMRFAPNSLSGSGAIEVAFGSGMINHGGTIPLPSGNFSYDAFLATVSPGNIGNTSNTINNIRCSLSGPVVTAYVTNNNNTVITGTANWMAIAWRGNA